MRTIQSPYTVLEIWMDFHASVCKALLIAGAMGEVDFLPKCFSDTWLSVEAGNAKLKGIADTCPFDSAPKLQSLLLEQVGEIYLLVFGIGRKLRENDKSSIVEELSTLSSLTANPGNWFTFVLQSSKKSD